MSFKVKKYDLGDYVEKIGYYSDVVEEMQSAKNGDYVSTGTDRSYKHEVPQWVKDQANKDKSIRRSKTKIRRVVTRYKMKYMWTLTFSKKFVTTFNPVNKKESNYDAGDYDDAWKLWNSFIKRCYKSGLHFNYVVTCEVQEKRLHEYGEKVYHFHFLTDKQIPIDPKNARKQGKDFDMFSLWKHGYVYVTTPKSKKKMAYHYVTKYIAKLIDELGSGRQRYRISNNLEIPYEEVFLNNHVEFYLGNHGEEVSSHYSIMGDKLEIFWCMVSKSGLRQKFRRELQT